MSIRQINIDPTYLRTINDGLLSGAINKDNASALPMGLVGMYEAALPPASNVNDRKKLLAFFSVWALLKKEVDAEFVAPLLPSWTNDEVIKFIGNYSKWFNSPVSGKYVLYHERFRTFVLQKLSRRQFEESNNAIIRQCQLALKERLNNDWERYTLEHLSSHLLINAMESSDGSALKALAYDTTHWNRQIEISKDFEWSKRLLNDMMFWASKYDDDQVIECALNKVDLHHMEQNDAPRIVQLVADNDIETALIRIEAFGGNDKEGIQRKFILYMLCLMELTLLDSKDKPFRKEAIEKLLNHLDEQLPTDHSILNWDEFFPSYLMFQMACELVSFESGILKLFERTEDYEMDWIAEMGLYSELQFEELIKWSSRIKLDRDRCFAIKDISSELFKQGYTQQSKSMIQEALDLAKELTPGWWKDKALNEISLQMCKHGQVEKALSITLDISVESARFDALSDIAFEISKQGQIDESLAIVKDINNPYFKSKALTGICAELYKSGYSELSKSLLNESQVFAQGITDKLQKCSALMNISAELITLDEIEISETLIKESFAEANNIFNKMDRARTLMNMSFQLFKQGFIYQSESVISEAFTCAQSIVNDAEKSEILTEIAIQASQTNFLNFSEAIVRSIIEDTYLIKALTHISGELLRKVHLEKSNEFMQKSIAIANGIRYDRGKNFFLKRILSELVKHGSIERSHSCLQESLVVTRGVSDDWEKSHLLKAISLLMSEHGRLMESVYMAGKIPKVVIKVRCLCDVAGKIFELGDSKTSEFLIREAIEILQGIIDEGSKSFAFKKICLELIKIGNVKEAQVLLKEWLHFAQSISDSTEKYKAYEFIAIELTKLTLMEEVYDIAKNIGDEYAKICILNAIFAVQINIGNVEKSELVIQESLSIANGISEGYLKCKVMAAIAITLGKHGKLEESMVLVQSINDHYLKTSAIKGIAVELSAKGQVDQSLAIACYINDDYRKSGALCDMVKALCKLGHTEVSLHIAQGINDNYLKTSALTDIVVGLSKQDDWLLVEKIVWEIQGIDDRHECWKFIATETIKDSAWHKALESRVLLNSQEAQLYYLKGWANAIEINDVNHVCVNKALPILADDTESIELLLQKYAAHEVALGNPSKELISRLNRTLNIQWLLDITAQFAN